MSHDMGRFVKAVSHEIFRCQDGSSTLRDLRSGQAMHSQIGPWSEAREIFVIPSRLAERVRGEGPPLVLYDLGMGIAANALAAMAEWRLVPGPKRGLRVISFESDPSGLEQALAHRGAFPFLRDECANLLVDGHWESDGLSWELRSGSFESARLGRREAELIFHDFYAPQVAPRLWGRETFVRLSEAIAEEGTLLTYSAASAVRSALVLAGFCVGRGPGTAMKRESTHASLQVERLIDPLGKEWLGQICRSTKPLPEDHGHISTESALVEIAAHRQFRPKSVEF